MGKHWTSSWPFRHGTGQLHQGIILDYILELNLNFNLILFTLLKFVWCFVLFHDLFDIICCFKLNSFIFTHLDLLTTTSVWYMYKGVQDISANKAILNLSISTKFVVLFPQIYICDLSTNLRYEIKVRTGIHSSKEVEDRLQIVVHNFLLILIIFLCAWLLIKNIILLKILPPLPGKTKQLQKCPAYLQKRETKLNIFHVNHFENCKQTDI